MSDPTWIAALTPGDKVIVDHGGYTESRSVGTVARLTATQVLVRYNKLPAGDVRFWKETGQQVGSRRSYYSSPACLAPYTVEGAARIANRRQAQRVYRVLRHLKAGTLERLDKENLDLLAETLRKVGLLERLDKENLDLLAETLRKVGLLEIQEDGRVDPS